MRGEHALGVAEHGATGLAVCATLQGRGRSSVEQGAELGERDAFDGLTVGVGGGAEACRVRGEAEQVDRTRPVVAGQSRRRRGRAVVSGRGDVAAQRGSSSAGIGGLVCEGYRPRVWTGRRRRAHGARR